MNILWIEDFGGNLDSGKITLNSMFGQLLNFDHWSADELDLLESPSDLERFTTENSSLHKIALCRHYLDYVEFKSSHDIIQHIDVVIIDIRLGNKVDYTLDIPIEHQDKNKFHENAGFYIFNDLAYSGFPAEKMCFMTGESGLLQNFNEQCARLYIPQATHFEKRESDFRKLQDWIAKQNSDYTNLRRGVIEGSEWLSAYIEEDEERIQFRDFIKPDSDGHSIEIPKTDIKNYLTTLSHSLPVKQPSLGAINTHYRLFLRTLVHEWEESLHPDCLKAKHGNTISTISDIYTFAWIVKMARNWVSHANLLDPLTPQMNAFFFLVNMRAMFKLRDIQRYEHILLYCISSSPIESIDYPILIQNIDYADNNIDGILNGLRLDVSGHFGQKINAIYRRNTGNPDAEQHDYHVFLLQNFWVSLKSTLPKSSDHFLATLARHIYPHSFPEA